MTIIASVKVQDGIALGCDSATQVSGRDPEGKIGVFKVYQNAKKLFQFGNLPLGLLTYGIGNIGKKSIRTVIREFEKGYDFSSNKAYQVKDVAEELLGFMQNAYDKEYLQLDKENQPALGFFISGYSSNSSLGEEWEFVIPAQKEVKLVRPKEQFGSSWRGIAVPFTRLYHGFDPRAINELQESGVSADIIKRLKENYGAKIIYDRMPIKDALNFVEFILKTTIGLSSFEIGAPVCSEPVQIAVIDEDGFEWIKKPTLGG